MSLSAAVWPQFTTQVFRGGIGRLSCIGSYVNKQVTTFTFRAQATACSRHHTRTVMDAGCECAPWVRSANPSDSWDRWVGDYATVPSFTPLLCSVFWHTVPLKKYCIVFTGNSLRLHYVHRFIDLNRWVSSCDLSETNKWIIELNTDVTQTDRQTDRQTERQREGVYDWWLSSERLVTNAQTPLASILTVGLHIQLYNKSGLRINRNSAANPRQVKSYNKLYSIPACQCK